MVEYGSLEYALTIPRTLGKVVWVFHGSEKGILVGLCMVSWELFGERLENTLGCDIVSACASAQINRYIYVEKATKIQYHLANRSISRSREEVDVFTATILTTIPRPVRRTIVWHKIPNHSQSLSHPIIFCDSYCPRCPTTIQSPLNMQETIRRDPRLVLARHLHLHRKPL